jgi:hypothetical protein
MLLMPFSGRFSSVVACHAFRYKLARLLEDTWRLRDDAAL